MTDPQSSVPRGYGNIYTPHAGSMVIQVQREGGLANRTITLSPGQVRLLKHGWRLGAAVLALGIITWVFLAIQAVRVPILTRRLTQMQTDLKRVDTLKAQLAEMERHFLQVQRMLSAPAGTSTARPVAVATSEPSTPRRRSSRRAAAAVASDSTGAGAKPDSARTTPTAPATPAASDSLVASPERPIVTSP
jgi:hypothetical protein